MIAPGIYDLRYGVPTAVSATGCGPFSAGRGAIVTDGASALFQVDEPAAQPAPECVTRALRPLMVRPGTARLVLFSELSLWLAANFATCERCTRTPEVCDACTTRCGRVAGVPVYGWHVRRQLGLIEHRPAHVHLTALEDHRGTPVLHVSCDRWSYIRVGLVGHVPACATAFDP